MCNPLKKSGTIEKIIAHKGNLVIFPDSCREIPLGKQIAPFRSGAFIPKKCACIF